MAGNGAARCCDLCGEPLSAPGYGSGALADGLYCSLTCYALSSDRYIPPLDESTGLDDSTDLDDSRGPDDSDRPEGGTDDHET
jgi:hypothetical protein